MAHSVGSHLFAIFSCLVLLYCCAAPTCRETHLNFFIVQISLLLLGGVLLSELGQVQKKSFRIAVKVCYDGLIQDTLATRSIELCGHKSMDIELCITSSRCTVGRVQSVDLLWPFLFGSKERLQYIAKGTLKPLCATIAYRVIAAETCF